MIISQSYLKSPRQCLLRTVHLANRATITGLTKRASQVGAGYSDAAMAKKGVSIGDQIFDFELETEEAGVTANISELVKDSGVVLFFYPRANTPGCTKQACGFRDEYQKFQDAGYKVFGMSADKPKSQLNWKTKYSLPYSFLCDPDFKVLPRLGVSSAGKITRSHIVIAKGGKVQDVRIKVGPLVSMEEAVKTVTGADAGAADTAGDAKAEPAAAKAGTSKKAAAAAAAAAEEEQEDGVQAKKAKRGVAVGDAIFDFELDTEEEGVRAKMSELVKDSGVVLFFYPKANTGGCTKQACGFKDEYKKFQDAGYKVFGMSADKPKSQLNWKTKHSLPYSFLCDPEHKVLPRLGVSSAGKITRSHIVIAKGGKVQDVRIGVKPAESVEEAVKTVTA